MQHTCKLAGASFRHADAKAALADLAIGETLTLERDPTNKWDPNAIKVLVGEAFVGFIPKELAETVAVDMDHGRAVTCTVIDTDEMLKPGLRLDVA